MLPPRVLTIAGSDCSGGAGLQADLKVFQRFGCYGMSVVTLVTAQNTLGVARLDLLPAESVRAQLAAVWDDLPPAAVKTGALGSTELIRAVAGFLAARPRVPLVVDPVLVSKHGHPLLPPAAVPELAAALLPLASVVTPNRFEAEALSGVRIADRASALAAAERLRAAGAQAVIVKGVPGAHGADDLLLDAQGATELPGLRIETRASHGTGCTFAAALAAHLAHGLPLAEAARRAKAYLAAAIAAAPGYGRGCGPLHHGA